MKRKLYNGLPHLHPIQLVFNYNYVFQHFRHDHDAKMRDGCQTREIPRRSSLLFCTVGHNKKPACIQWAFVQPEIGNLANKN